MIEDKLIPLICERFLNDEKYRQGHIRIINALPERRILGLHLPEMKQTAKTLAKQADTAGVLHAFERAHEADRFSLTYEETLVWGLTINALKCSWEERLSFLKGQVLQILKLFRLKLELLLHQKQLEKVLHQFSSD